MYRRIIYKRKDQSIPLHCKDTHTSRTFARSKGFKLEVLSQLYSHAPGIYFYKEDNPLDSSWLLLTVHDDNPRVEPGSRF